MRTVVGRFSADGNDGRAYSVEMVRANVPGNAAAVGAVSLFTTNGRPVTRMRKGEYRVDATGVTLTSVAATAP